MSTSCKGGVRGILTLGYDCLQVSPNCALYNVKGFVNQSEPFVNNETVIFVAAGGNIVDACGAPFNTSVVQVSQPHR